MRIEFDEDVEDKQYYTCRPTQTAQQPALRGPIEASDGEETVRDEITHQDQVHDTSEYQPCVVLKRRFFELVVLWDLGLHLALDQLVYGGMRVLASLGVLKDARVSCPQDEAVVFGLAIKQPTYASVVGSSPREEDDSKDGYAGAFGQHVQREDQAGEHSKNGKVGQIFWLRGREQL